VEQPRASHSRIGWYYEEDYLMSVEQQKKKDFFARDVAGAIQQACEECAMPQESLEIEVIETGTSGIFGLIRKKAHIRVRIKPSSKEQGQPSEVEEIFGAAAVPDIATDLTADDTPPSEAGDSPGDQPQGGDQAAEDLPTASSEKEKNDSPERTVAKSITDQPAEVQLDPKPQPKDEPKDLPKRAADSAPQPQQPTQESAVSDENVEIVKRELLKLVEMMGCPSTVEVEVKGTSITCTLQGDHQDELIGPEGKVLDSLQYLIRKIIGRKISERVRINIDCGSFRTRRMEELKSTAVELATLAKEEGKTQVMVALNPGERREIHMVLQQTSILQLASLPEMPQWQ
jgi:spoIIIJ-associated protein